MPKMMKDAHSGAIVFKLEEHEENAKSLEDIQKELSALKGEITKLKNRVKELEDAKK
jgi:predicted  nucleic acid-binding Zn-ribbon protein